MNMLQSVQYGQFMDKNIHLSGVDSNPTPPGKLNSHPHMISVLFSLKLKTGE